MVLDETPDQFTNTKICIQGIVLQVENDATESYLRIEVYNNTNNVIVISYDPI